MTDSVNHPAHYQGFSNGAEIIDITENLSFNLGNVVKYVARAGRKHEEPLEDLRKAQWYLDREIHRLQLAEDQTAWSIDSLRVELQRMWEARHPGVKVTYYDADLNPLPEGLEPIEGKFWKDNEGWLWKFDGKTWQYYEKEDEEWIDITGPPSTIYAPFKEVDLWHKG